MPAMLHQISPLHKEAQTESLWVCNETGQDLSCPVLSCPVLSCPVLSCLAGQDNSCRCPVLHNDRTQQHAGFCAIAKRTVLKDSGVCLHVSALNDELAAKACCSHALSWEAYFTEGCQKLLQGSSMRIQAVMIQRDTPPLGTAVAASRCDAI